MKKIGWPGKGYKFTCQRCGFQYPSTEIKKEWTGVYVCHSCWEPRHPQTLIRVSGEKAFPDVVSKDSDVFVNVCDLTTSNGYVDLGTTDCMRVETTTHTYEFLKDTLTNGHS